MTRRIFGAFQPTRAPLLAFLMLGYVVAAMGSILLLRSGQDMVGLWVANAFAVAVLLRLGVAGLGISFTAIFAAAAIANALAGNGFGSSLVYAFANAASVTIGVALVALWRRERSASTSAVLDYSATLALSGGIAPLIAGSLFAAVAPIAFETPALVALWIWWSGDALGFTMLLPLFLLISAAELRAIFRRRRAVGFLAALAGCAVIAVASMVWTGIPFMFVMVALMIGAAIFSPLEMAILCAATAATMIAVALVGDVSVLQWTTARPISGFQLSLAISIGFPYLAALLIDQHRRDRRRISESEQRFRRAMEDSAIGVAIVGLDRRIIETNRAFAEMLGYTRPELEALTFFSITHPDDIPIDDETMRRILAGEADSYRFEKRYLRKDGTAVWANLAGSVISDETTGKPLYLVSQIEDIDARKKAEARITEAETRWNFALASAGQGVWSLDLAKGGTIYSPTWARMLGYDDHELDGDPDLWLTMIHPDDRERVEIADREHLDGHTPYFEAEFRMRHKSGRWLWILDRGKALERDADGRLIRAIGSLTDITRRKEAEDRLAVSAAMLADEKERLRVMLRSIGDAVISTDSANRVTFMNPVAEKLTGVASGDALGKELGDVYVSVDEETGARLTDIGSGQTIDHNQRAVLLRRDGTRCSIRTIVSPIVTDGEEVSGSVIVFQDFTDARTLQRELAYAASHDALTGLANRSSFMRTMDALVADVRLHGTEHQFLYIDLDHFKSVNDTGGHAAGDALLKEVAGIIRAIVRPQDIVARLGGDEFAIVMMSCPANTAQDIAEHLVEAIGDLGGVAADGNAHSIGASIGRTSIRRGYEAVDEIVARADAACYSAKAAGRGCVTAFEPGSAILPIRGKGFAAAS